jgi:hypothetical protein
VLTYDAASGPPTPGGGTDGTRGSFTLRIVAPDFRLENMTVENGFDYPANAAKSAEDPTRLRDPQAVALMTDEASDRAVFRNCKISGYQDTLFANAGRQYYHRCTILGHVDFIFGAGRAVFEDSDIVSRDRGASPVLLTPVVRRRFDAQGAFYDTHGEYPDVVRAVAAEHHVPLVDLHRASERAVREQGVEGSKRLFLHLAPNEHPNYPAGLEDDTHFSPQGARRMAELAVQAMRELRLGLAEHLVTPAADPSAAAARR